VEIEKPFRVEAINLETKKKVKVLVIISDNYNREMVWDHNSDHYYLLISGINNVNGDLIGENEHIANFMVVVEEA
jgi:hypothetical protein